MKDKLKILLAACSILIVSACGGNDAVNPSASCEKNLENYTASLNAFSSAPTRKSCTALVATLDEIVNKCNTLTAAQRAEYNKSKADIDCTAFPN